jgi:hypothetical protein
MFWDVGCSRDSDCVGIQIDVSSSKLDRASIIVLWHAKRKSGTTIVEWGTYRSFEVDKKRKKLLFRYNDNESSYSGEADCSFD